MRLSLASLILSTLAVLAPMSHVIELPNKLSLDGGLWLAVQQHLYRGWGPLLGAPTEIGALASSLLLASRHRRTSLIRRPLLIAASGYVGMIAAFFTLNLPTNTAVATWTQATLPADWTSYRLRWELGHALAALLGLISLAAVILAYQRDHRSCP